MANRNDDRESDHSGEMGRRNRTTPGRTPGELGLDPEEMPGHDAIAQRGDRTGDDIPLTTEDDTAGPRQDPPLTPGVEKDGTGGVSESGGLAGGARGNAGESDTGVGGRNGESRSGPGEYKSTSRGTFDRGQA